MTKLTKNTFKRGDQTSVFKENSRMWQVQTWTGTRWYGFLSVPPHNVVAEKRRQLATLEDML